MCLAEFWSLHSCIKHVDSQATEYCKEMYRVRSIEYDEALVICADEVAALHRQQMEAEGRRQTCAATEPAVRLEGPLPQVAAMRPIF